MPIKAALFDCDGTLLDSMRMWTNCCVSLLKRYGVNNAEQVFAEHESLDMDKKCYWYHDNLGIGSSGEALYRELWDTVSEAYAHEVTPYKGCREFLEELKVKRIPCAIVSSTPTELVMQALGQHGLLDYFQEVVFVGDVGRSKEFSDCYLAVAKRLGKRPEDTWVFEDAPFGVRSAARAGFPTVAIFNDHDGRDETFVRAWATIVACSYEGLSTNRLNECGPRITHALIVAGSPKRSDPGLIAQLAKNADLIIAADGGVDALHAACVVPHLYCGDQDSASRAGIEWAQKKGTSFDLHPSDKDDTDLDLAIQMARTYAEQRGSALRLTVTCASGGRSDHALGVWGILASNVDACPRVVEDGFECRILSPLGDDTWIMDVPKGTTVSAIALAPHTRGSECGMRWNLESAEFELLGDFGVSNRVENPCASIECEAGVLAVFCLR